jgi:endonuclease G
MRKLFVIVVLLFAISVYFANAQALELPYTEDEVLEYTGFSLVYSEEHEQALWVAYHLTKEEALGEFPRKNNFREDPNIVTGTATLDDYRGTGYDRGHLAPAGDMKWSAEAMDDSFYMSNMSPQVPGFNRDIWRQLEALVRYWAIVHEELYIVTGPILTDGPYETIGENEVSVPKRYFKVILDYREPDIRMIAFILTNEKSKTPLYTAVVTVDTVEYITGLDFFPTLEDELEERLEGEAHYFVWEEKAGISDK